MRPFALHSRAAFAVFFPSVVRIERWLCTLEEIIAMIIHAKQKQTREGENEINPASRHYLQVCHSQVSVLDTALGKNESLSRSQSRSHLQHNQTHSRATGGDLSRDEF